MMCTGVHTHKAKSYAEAHGVRRCAIRCVRSELSCSFLSFGTYYFWFLLVGFAFKMEENRMMQEFLGITNFFT